MITHPTLERAVLAAPDDDLPRLVYADWLDEHGEGERAEFIRIQCAWNTRPLCPNDKAHSTDECAWCSETRRMAEREQELFDLHSKDWFTIEHTSLFPPRLSRAIPGIQNIPKYQAIVRRGFVDELVTPFLWMGNSDIGHRPLAGLVRIAVRRMLKLCPITRLTPSDYEPSCWSAGDKGQTHEWVWERSMSDQPDPEEFSYLDDTERDILPPVLFDGLIRHGGYEGTYYFVIGKYGHWRYDTEDDAYRALSDRMFEMLRSETEL